MELASKDAVSFWRRVGADASVDPDYAASLDRFIPLWLQRAQRTEQMRFARSALLDLPGPVDVLDLGCGPGTWALELARDARSVTGVDISEGFIAHARHQAQSLEVHNTRFSVGSLLDFGPGGYGFVMVGAVLQYVEDDVVAALFRKLHEAMPDDVVIYVRVPVSPRARIVREGRCHATYRTLCEYLKIFSAAGFSSEVTRDAGYSESMITVGAFATVHALTLGGIARWPVMQRGLVKLLDVMRPLSFGLGVRLLDVTTAPRAFNLLLRRAR